MRKFATWGFSFAAAVFISQYLLSGPAQLICAGAAFILFVVSLFIRADFKRRLNIIMVGLAVGFLFNAVYSYFTLLPTEFLDGSETAYTAEAVSFPTERYTGVSVNVSLHTGHGDESAVMYVYDGSADDIRPGDRLSFTAKVSAADTIRDEKTDYYFSRGSYAIAKSVKNLTITEKAEAVPPKYFHLYAARAVKDGIRAVFPEDTYPFALALLTGDKSVLTTDYGLTSNLQRAGIYHIATVSGMHVSIFAAFFMLIFGRKRRTALILAPSLIFFAALVGFTPSVVRAVIMELFILAAPIFKREEDRLTSLAAALVFLLMLNPFSALNAGLQLSFASMLGIILFSERMFAWFKGLKRVNNMRRSRLKKLLFKAAGGVSVTLGAMLTTAPLSVLYFGYISLASPITNLLVMPAVSPAFAVSAVSVAAGMVFLPAGKALAFIASLLLRYIGWAARLCSGSFLSSVYIDHYVIAVWFVFAYAVLLALILMRKEAKKLVVPICAAALTLCVILIASTVGADTRGGFTLTALDVGQGQCVVVTSGPFTAVFDCGSTSSSTAGDTCVRYIYGLGRDAVDLLCLTHYHADHANGVKELLERITVKALAVPLPEFDDGELDEEIIALAESLGTDIIYVTEDMTVDLGGADLTLFAPMGRETENERGVTVMVAEGGFEALITGDIGGELEVLLAETKALPDIECLVVSHHGSKYSSDADFLARVRPEIGIISVGAHNTYGHPTAEAMERLEAAGAEIYRTDILGNITVNSKESMVYG